MYILRVRMRERCLLRPPKFVRIRVRVRIRVHVTGGVLARGLTGVGRLSEQPHWRWPKQGAAVAKQGSLGELSGLCKVYRPKRRPAEGAVLFRPITWLYSASVVLGSTLHLALGIFQQGIPCFGHRPKKYNGFKFSFKMLLSQYIHRATGSLRAVVRPDGSTKRDTLRDLYRSLTVQHQC